MLNSIEFMGQNLYYLGFYFIIFSFLGWLMETCLCSFKAKEFVHRGFLTSPFCPIYGTGMVIIIIFLSDISHNIILLFLGGVAVTTALEYIVGALLERIFKAKWWDYSDRKLNLGGYVCLTISLCWGVLCVIMMRWIVPYITSLIDGINIMFGNIFIYSFFIVIVLDTSITIYNLVGLNKILEELSKAREEFKAQIEKTDLYLKTGEFIEKYNEFKYETIERLQKLKTIEERTGSIGELWKERLENMAEEIRKDPTILEITNAVNDIKKKQEKSYDRYNFFQKRILEAFPGYRPLNNKEALKELKEKISQKKRDKSQKVHKEDKKQD